MNSRSTAECSCTCGPRFNRFARKGRDSAGSSFDAGRADARGYMSLHLLLTRFRFDPGPADRHAGAAFARTYVPDRTTTYMYARVHRRTRGRCKLRPEMQRLAVVVGRLDNTVA